jgi:hypothetical protein
VTRDDDYDPAGRPKHEQVVPTDRVMRLLGHSAESSTRKEMSRHGMYAVHGWTVEDVMEVLWRRGQLEWDDE